MTWRNSPKSVSFVVLLGVGLVSFQFCSAWVCPAWGGTGDAAGDLSEKSPRKNTPQNQGDVKNALSKDGQGKTSESKGRLLSRGYVPKGPVEVVSKPVFLPREVTYGPDGVCYYTCAQQDRAQSDPDLGNKPSL